MSVKDLPDYTRQVVIRYEGGFIGLEELAARLGSIVPYDLRGNIVLVEDFESEETEWEDGSDVPLSTATRSSRRKYSGDWAMKLHSALTGGGLADTWRNFSYPGLVKCACFCRFAFDQYCRDFYVRSAFWNATSTLYAHVKYNPQTNLLTIRAAGGVWHSVDSDLYIYGTEFCWHPFMLTFDLATGYYDKLVFAQEEYDISDVALYSYAGLAEAGAYVEVYADGAIVNAFDVYVDDIIIAKNVP